MHDTSTGGNDPTERPAPRGRVLAIAGDVDTLSLIRLTLERAGYEVLAATTAGGADQLLTRDGRRVDLLVSAARLPDGDGIAFARRIGRRLRCPTLTICAEDADARRSDTAGVDAHIREQAVERGLIPAVTALLGPPDER